MKCHPPVGEQAPFFLLGALPFFVLLRLSPVFFLLLRELPGFLVTDSSSSLSAAGVLWGKKRGDMIKMVHADYVACTRRLRSMYTPNIVARNCGHAECVAYRKKK